MDSLIKLSCVNYFSIFRSSNRQPERYVERENSYEREDRFERVRSPERRRKDEFEERGYDRDRGRSSFDNRFEDDRFVSNQISDNMKSRLTDKPRDPNESMGIFANESHKQQYQQQQNHHQQMHHQPSPNGYRIIVSNLHSSVSDGDVKELFEDIGPLISSKLVRPGVAEVVYVVSKDAEEAVETYHNRQLDGQPMKVKFNLIMQCHVFNL